MKVFVILLLGMFSIKGLLAQSSDSLKASDGSKTVKDHFDDREPEFPGGFDSMRVYVSRNMHYPEEALNKGIHGVVRIKFIVNQDGTIVNARIIDDIGYGCGEEALRVVKSMPNWIPAKMGGKPAKIPVTIPITFYIR